MNIINTQQMTNAKGTQEAGETNLLAGLMANLSPEEAEAKKVEFQNLLGQMNEETEGNPENSEELIEGKTELSKNLHLNLLNHNSEDKPAALTLSKQDGKVEAKQVTKKSLNPLQLLRKNSEKNTETISQEEVKVDASKSENVKKPFFVSPKSIFTAKNAKSQNPTSTENTDKLVDNKELLNLNQFMSKQSPALKKNAMAKSYAPISNSMFNNKVEASLPGVIKMQGAVELNKEENELIGDDLGSKFETESRGDQAFLDSRIGRSEMISNTKSVKPTFDISQLNAIDSSEEVINKVQDYIIQSKAQNQKQVEMSFNHQEFGKVDLMVQKAAGNHLNIVITSHGNEGTQFFQKHQGELLQTLSHNGVQINDFKLESSNSSQSSMNQDSGKGQFSQNSRQGFGSEQGERQSDSQKRQNLWNQFYDKEVA